MTLFSFLRHYNKCIWKAVLFYFYSILLLFLFIWIFIPLIILNIFIVSFILSYYLTFFGLFTHLTLLFDFASCPVWFASFFCWPNTFEDYSFWNFTLSYIYGGGFRELGPLLTGVLELNSSFGVSYSVCSMQMSVADSWVL